MADVLVIESSDDEEKDCSLVPISMGTQEDKLDLDAKCVEGLDGSVNLPLIFHGTGLGSTTVQQNKNALSENSRNTMIRIHDDSSSSSDSDSKSPIVKRRRATRTRRQPLNKQDRSNNEPMKSIIDPFCKNTDIFSNRVTKCFNNVPKGSKASDNEDDGKKEIQKRAKRIISQRTSEKENDNLEKCQGEPVVVIPDDDSRAWSPSPPPTPTPPSEVAQIKMATRQTRRQPRAIKSIFRNLESAKYRIESENFGNRLNSSTVSEDSFSEILSHGCGSLEVKVRSCSGIHRFHLYMDQSFECIYESMAVTDNVPRNKCLLFLGDTNISPFSTPQAVKLTVADILHFTVKQDDVPVSGIASDDDDVLEITLQGRGTRSKMQFTIKKDEVIRKLAVAYADAKNLSLDDMKLYFDGDLLGLNMTPEGVDMADGDCIDVICE